jgi:hypothetical protein
LLGFGKTYLVERPCRVSRNSKVEVKRQVQNILLGIAQRSLGSDLCQTIADEPDSIHEQTVGRALDLKVSEECVGAEKGEDLVEDVVALAVGVGRLVGRQGRRGVRQSVGRTSGLGTEREERKVADYAGDVGVIVEDGVVCLERCCLAWLIS